MTLGALLADTPHTRPIPVSGTATEPDLADRLKLEQSNYEGPTGIVGVFQDACVRTDMPAVSFWAAVPHYVAQPPCPKATLALLGQLEDLLLEVVFVVSEASADAVEAHVARGCGRHMPTRYVVQKSDGRAKPWGTGHAVLTASEEIDGDRLANGSHEGTSIGVVGTLLRRPYLPPGSVRYAGSPRFPGARRA